MRFALEAAHWLAGNPRHLRHAAAIDRFIGARLTGQHYSGLWSAAPAPDCTKLQNPLMRLFEAYLFLHCAAPAGPYLAKVGALVRLPEWRQQDWALPSPTECYFEHRYHFEWIWLLVAYDEASGANYALVREALWRNALSAGLDARRHCLDAVRHNLRPQRSSNRLWPHAEAIKAACCMAAAAPDQAACLCDNRLAALFRTLLDRPIAGGWIDHSQDRTPWVDYVRARSFYHLHLAHATFRPIAVTQHDPPSPHHPRRPRGNRQGSHRRHRRCHDR